MLDVWQWYTGFGETTFYYRVREHKHFNCNRKKEKKICGLTVFLRT